MQDARSKGVSALELAQQIIQQDDPLALNFNDLQLVMPIYAQEIWAAGV